jgi:beta-lactamase regulating signal transducer with metallopeptidase domain
MQTLVEYGLANAVSATALAVVALLVGFVIRRPAVRNALWILVLVRLLMPPVWTIPLPVPDIRAGSEADPAPTTIVSAPPPSADLLAADWVRLDDPLPELTPGDELADTIPAVNPEPAAAPAIAPTPVAAGPSVPVDPFFVLGLVWVAGTVFVLARSAHRIARFRRALADARPAPAEIQDQTSGLARAMGLHRSPAVLIVPGRVWPSLWMPGLFVRQARLIVPAGLLPLLDAGQRAAVLAHELSHLRRRDPWVRWLELVVCGVYWWHPLLGWFRRKLRESEEECCDMWVVAAQCGRQDYATALVETAAFLGNTESGPVPVLASGAGPVQNLQRRVTMIMRATWPARLTRIGLAAVLGIGGLGLAFGPALAQDPPRPKDKDRPAKERPDDRDRDRERDRDARERARDDDRERGSREDVARAREAVERARQQAREANEKLRQAEEALARAEGRNAPAGGGRFAPPDLPGRRPGVGPPPGVPAVPVFPRPPAVETPGRAGPGNPRGGELREMQQQIDELRRLIEQMRREMRGGPDRGRGDREADRPGESRRDRGRPEAAPGTPALPGIPGVPGTPGRPGAPGAGRPPAAPNYPTPPAPPAPPRRPDRDDD